MKFTLRVDSREEAKDRGVRYLHCGECLKEKPADVTPKDWARQQVAMTPEGLQVWCTRHNINVMDSEMVAEVTPLELLEVVKALDAFKGNARYNLMMHLRHNSPMSARVLVHSCKGPELENLFTALKALGMEDFIKSMQH